jgi:hypothetical protein
MDRELDRLSTALGLPVDQVARLLEELRALYSQTLPDFVRSRHTEYKQQAGLRNEEAYRRIQEDIQQWRFRAPEISIRQIRRMIHG